MKTSWRAIQHFAVVADAYQNNNGADTKLRYAINRVLTQVRKHQEAINQKIGDIEIENCVTDDKDVIQRDASGNLQYTRDGLKRRNQLTRELCERADIEIDPHIVATPAGLDPVILDAFLGFVIDSEPGTD